MKKLLSLLLAGLMMFALAGSTLAAGNSIFDNDNSYIYETIFGKNWYYWYLLNGGKFPSVNPLDPVDPDFPVTPNKDIPTSATAKCPTTNCDNTGKVYYSTSDNKNYVLNMYCLDHGMQPISSSIVNPGTGILPGTTATYTISTSAGVGGSINLSVSSTFGSATVNKGDDVQVSIVPDYGYVVEAVYLNGYYIGKTEGFSLDDIHANYSVRAIFRRIDVTRKYTITASASGEGNVYAVVNGKSAGKFTSLTGTYADTVTLRFTPNSENYKVESVTVNGTSIGAVSFYEVGRLVSDMTVSAKFVWDCPYTDVAKEHMDAVEYVSEIDVMGSPNLHFNTDMFMGKNTVSVRSMACYLAELADVSDKLNSVADRIAWATEKGLIGDKEDLSVSVTWTRACDMLAVYVRNLEKDGNVVFKDLVNAESAYAIAHSMDLVTEASYKADGKICRYDMAEICYAIALLETK